jgi:hypothetical protein
MNKEMNKEMNNEDIRPPDETKRETLIPAGNQTYIHVKSQEELDIEEAIRKSNEIAEMHDKIQMDSFMGEIQKRREQFRNIKFIFNRVGKVDKEVAEVYEIIQYIIDSYILGDIETYKWDKETYNTIFKVIKNLRLNEVEMTLLTNLFQVTI